MYKNQSQWERVLALHTLENISVDKLGLLWPLAQVSLELGNSIGVERG